MISKAYSKRKSSAHAPSFLSSPRPPVQIKIFLQEHAEFAHWRAFQAHHGLAQETEIRGQKSKIQHPKSNIQNPKSKIQNLSLIRGTPHLSHLPRLTAPEISQIALLFHQV
jgi:hypothetical protein